MLRLLPPLDVLDPEAWMAAAVALFARYPEIIGDRAATVIPTRSDRPTLKLMADILDEIFKPIEREAERRTAHKDHDQHRALPKPPRTAEQQARIDDQIADWELRRAGIQFEFAKAR